METLKSESTQFLLSADNYNVWIVPMEARLAKLNVLGVINGRESSPTDVELKPKYLMKLQEAYIEIIQNLDPSNMALVATTLPVADRFNGLALWNLLKSRYAGNDAVARSVAFDRFNSIPFTDVNSFVQATRAANHRMLLTGNSLDDATKVSIVLKKLPSSFEAFREVVRLGLNNESLEAILTRIETRAIQNDTKQESSSSDQAAMIAQSSVASSKIMAACPHCKKPGHRPSNCWIKYPNKKPMKEIQNEYAHFTHYHDVNGNLKRLKQEDFDSIHL